MIGLLALPYPMTVASTVGSAGDANFPATNLTNNDYARVARYTNPNNANGSVATVFDLAGAARDVNVFGVLWHNLPSGGYIRVSASNNPDGLTNAVYDSGHLSPMTGGTQREQLPLWKFLVSLGYVINARYWRVELFVGANSTTQASRVFIGKGANFIIGPQKATLGAKDLNANVTTEVGETRSQEDPTLIRPVISLSFEYAKQSEMELLLGAYTLNLGVSRPMLVCSDLTSAYLQDNMAFGRAEKVVTLESTIYDIWSFEAVVTSLGV